MNSWRTWRNGLLVVGGVVALGGGLWFVLRPTQVAVSRVSVRDLGAAIQGVGTVEAKAVVQVGAKITGRVVSILVDQGDTVKTGQVLARLDDAQLRADVARSEAALAAAEAQRRDLEAGTRKEEIEEAHANVVRAQAQLDDLLAGSRKQEIDELEERLKSAGATRVLTERELRRMQELFAKELVSAQEVDRARQAYEVASAQERGARQTLQIAVEGARKHQIDAARAQLKAAQDRLELLRAGPRPHQVDGARAQVREAQASLALARERQADSVLLSPLDGYVVSRDLEPGTTVNPGTPVLKIADPKSGWVTVHVDERETSGIKVGDPAEIALRSVPGRTLRGRVARVQRESDRVTEQLAVDIAFEERPPRLTLGEQAEATIRPAGRSQVVALPLSALVRTPDGLGTWVVVDGRLEFRPTRLGVVDPAGWVEVLEGVRVGEQVVVAPGRLADRGHEGRRVLATPVTDGTTQAKPKR